MCGVKGMLRRACATRCSIYRFYEMKTHGRHEGVLQKQFNSVRHQCEVEEEKRTWERGGRLDGVGMRSATRSLERDSICTSSSRALTDFVAFWYA